MKSLALDTIFKIDEKSGYSILHAICINKDVYTATRIAVQAICAGHDIEEHRVRQRRGSKSEKAERFAGMSVIDILEQHGEYVHSNMLKELLCDLRDQSSRLLKAVTTEDAHQVVRLVREGKYVNQIDACGGWGRETYSPLTVASMTGGHEILSTLIDLGADVSPQGERVRRYWYRVQSPLSVASAWNNYNAVKLLMRKGADVNQIDRYGNTALHYAAANGNVEIVKLLLDSGARIDKNDKEGNTAMHLALVPPVSSELSFPPFGKGDILLSGSAPLRTKRRQTSKYLIERKFQVDKKNSLGQTPLYLALSSADTETVLFLTEKKSHGKGSALGMSSGEAEATERRKEVKKEGREEKGFKEGKRGIKGSPLSLSTERNVQALRHLVDMKLLDVNMTDDSERTPLHEASQAGDIEAVGLLLRLGVDISAVDIDGRTALHLAIHQSHPEVALKLIYGGANVNIQDNTGSSSLHKAAMLGLEDVIDALLKHDVDINAVDIDGRTALHYATRQWPFYSVVIMKLINAGAKADPEDPRGKFAEIGGDRESENILEGVLTSWPSFESFSQFMPRSRSRSRSKSGSGSSFQLMLRSRSGSRSSFPFMPRSRSGSRSSFQFMSGSVSNLDFLSL